MSIEEILGIKDLDEINRLATALVEADYGLMRALVKAREDSGLTLAQISERMGISEASVRDLESSQDPRLSTLRRYSLAIGALVVHEVTPGAIDPHGGL